MNLFFTLTEVSKKERMQTENLTDAEPLLMVTSSLQSEIS